MTTATATPLQNLVDRLVAEGLIGQAQAARLCGTFRLGRPVHPSTIGRWCLRGATTADGRAVTLEHLRMPGGRLATSRPALLRFLSELQPDAPAPAAPPARSPHVRRAESETAAAELIAAGA